MGLADLQGDLADPGGGWRDQGGFSGSMLSI